MDPMTMWKKEGFRDFSFKVGMVAWIFIDIDKLNKKVKQKKCMYKIIEGNGIFQFL